MACTMKKKLDPFDQFIWDVPVTTSVVQEKLYEAKVPNRHPSITNTPYRIAIIADEPSRDDILGGQPFLGAAGRSLTLWLSRAGILRDACFLGYSNDPDRLTHDLNVYSPHICLLLGRNTLWLAHGTHSLGDWRGSVFVSSHPGPFKGRKCIPSYHPADCNRNYDWTPLLFFDIKKCLAHGKDAGLTLPARELRVNLSVDEIIGELEKIKSEKPTIALDIEGYVDAMSCLSIAPDKGYSFIIPFATKAGSSLHSAEDEVRLWRHLANVLEDPQILKVLQNSLYDRFVLQYSYKLVVRGVIDDTMLRFWEMWCELPKGLGFQASILTDEPYWKDEGKQ